MNLANEIEPNLLSTHMKEVRFSNFSHHNRDVMSPVAGQGTIQLQQSMLGFQEAAEVKWMQGHHHGDMVYPTQWEERLGENVLVWPFIQNLERNRRQL